MTPDSSSEQPRRPGSSWQRWVTGVPRGRRGGDDGHDDGGADERVAPAGEPEPFTPPVIPRDPVLPTGPPAGEPLSMTPGADDVPEGDGGLDVHLDWPGSDEEAAVADEEPLEDDDFDDDTFAADEAHDLADPYDDGGYTDEDDDDLAGSGVEGTGAGLPAVPLLPAMAGRLESVHGGVASLSMRIDALADATSAFRAATTDRIDDYAQAVDRLGRSHAHDLDEYRRATERVVSELRRQVVDSSGMLAELVARVEELGTDVGGLTDQVRLAATERAAAPRRGRAARAGDSPPVDADVAAARNEVLANDLERRLRDALAPVAGVADDLRVVRELTSTILDALPASAEGSGIALDLGESADAMVALARQLSDDVGSVRAGLDDLNARIVARAGGGSAGVDIDALAEAVARRIGPPVLDAAALDRLADAVVARLEGSFEIVADEPATSPPAPPPPEPEATAAKGRGRRRRG